MRGTGRTAAADGVSGGANSVEVVARDERREPPQDEAVDVDRWSGLAAAVLGDRGVRGGELNLLFVDETTMAGWNEEHMGETGPTDVLSFPIDGLDADGPLAMIGDVVLCPAVAARNAPSHAGSFDAEIALLVVHGVLHVLGMDHAEPGEEAEMKSLEAELLERFHR